MKNIVNILLFLFMFLSARPDDSIPEKLKPEPPQPDVEESNSDDDSKNCGNNQDSVLPALSVAGRYLEDGKGEIINLHGFAQTYSPFFSNNVRNSYDVQGCLNYNKSMADGILAAGWKLNFVRMYLDPYWSDDLAMQPVRYEGHERFSEFRLRKYLDELLALMAEYFMSKGVYVVMHPPGVCPSEASYQGIELEDSYQQFLLKVWNIISQHPKLKNNIGVMLEPANESVKIKGTDGTYDNTGDGCFQNLQLYFQVIVDKIRTNSRNIIWVLGLSYQSSCAGYVKYRIQGKNIGSAVHCYPDWYGSDAEEDNSEDIGSSTGGGYESLQRGWDARIGPVAAFAPIMVTEIDWAPKKYNATQGKSITEMAGEKGSGANFKHIVDNSGNMLWLFFTMRSHELAAFKGIPGTSGNYTFSNNPGACPWAIYHWFKEYTDGMVVNGVPVRLELMGQGGTLNLPMDRVNYLKVCAVYSDGSTRMVTAEADISSSNSSVLTVERAGKLAGVAPGNAIATINYQHPVTRASDTLTLVVTVLHPFSLAKETSGPSIWEKGSSDEDTHALTTGQYGFGGWQSSSGSNLSAYRTITVKLGNDNMSGASFRISDKNNYWMDPATYDFGSSCEVIVDLQNMEDRNGIKIDPSHSYIVGFRSTGNKPIIINRVNLE